ncbi:Serine/threonine-protein kinase smu1 [Physocladia obscura]|uniref:WD40 repeat-containing protein SMU1 n=1 Tax=Physocladia obscura TaxID=109957 RepID=A0AAD5XI76_9FUNG|nr:Serine/threonine-protein kinase smu1 [Physocladia obscura]
MGKVEVEAADVIRLVQQFLKENNLLRTLHVLQVHFSYLCALFCALVRLPLVTLPNQHTKLQQTNKQTNKQTNQEESGVALNTVDSLELFAVDVAQGRWDAVLRAVAPLAIPQRKLFDLYEHIAIELIELREVHAARSLLRQTDVMQLMRDLFPERYLHLEHLLSSPVFDPRAAYPNATPREKRRAIIAQSLSAEISVAAPSRLLTLLGQSLKLQKSLALIPDLDDNNKANSNSSNLTSNIDVETPTESDSALNYDLFRGVIVPTSHDHSTFESDMPASVIYKSFKFPKKAHPESVAFSPDGQFFVTGAADGMIEVWSYLTAKLRRDLKYQLDENFMAMDSAVLCLAFSKDSELLASGSQDGFIKIWKILTGQCVRRFPTAHSQGVTSVSFSRDGNQVLSSSFDQTIRIHGMKNGKMLKEFRGHISFANDAMFSMDGHRVLSASSDGTVKIWDARTAECMATVTLHEGMSVTSGVHSATVQKIIQMPNNADAFVVCNKSAFVYVVNMRGQVVKYFRAGKNNDKDSSAAAGGSGVKDGSGSAARQDIVTACVSAKGEFLYTITEDGAMQWYSIEGDGVFPLNSIKMETNIHGGTSATVQEHGHEYKRKLEEHNKQHEQHQEQEHQQEHRANSDGSLLSDTQEEGTISHVLRSLLSAPLEDNSPYKYNPRDSDQQLQLQQLQQQHFLDSELIQPTLGPLQTRHEYPPPPEPIHIEMIQTKHSLIDLSQPWQFSKEQQHENHNQNQHTPAKQLPRQTHQENHSQQNNNSAPAHSPVVASSPPIDSLATAIASSIFGYTKSFFSALNNASSSSPPSNVSALSSSEDTPSLYASMSRHDPRAALELSSHSELHLLLPSLPPNSPIVLTSLIAEKLRLYLPPLYREASNWRLSYSLDYHGISLNTLYHNCESEVESGNPVLLVIQDSDGGIFGAFANEAFHVQHGYFGNGSSFLWKVGKPKTPIIDDTVADAVTPVTPALFNTLAVGDADSRFRRSSNNPDVLVFKATGANEYLILGESHMIALGGGEGHFGLWVDSDLYYGHSGPCQTFNNEQLSRRSEFTIQHLEIWAFDI